MYKLHHVSPQPINIQVEAAWCFLLCTYFQKTFWKLYYASCKRLKTDKFFLHLYRMAPLVVLQKKVYISILRKELPRLVAIASGTPNHQSLQNIVCDFFHIPVICSVCFTFIFQKLHKNTLLILGHLSPRYIYILQLSFFVIFHVYLKNFVIVFFCFIMFVFLTMLQ